MTKIIDERLADAEWLEHAARYFEKLDTGGEDMAFWANVANAERCRSIAQSLRAQGGVGVKPLEWTRGWMNAEAQTEIGQYIITYRRDGSFEWGIGILKGWASSWDEAKSAAQADYERRILSSLEASPAPVSEPVRAALCAIHRKLAEEGGGTWATYMMIEIASAYNDLEIVEPIEASLAAKGGQ